MWYCFNHFSPIFERFTLEILRDLHSVGLLSRVQNTAAFRVTKTVNCEPKLDLVCEESVTQFFFAKSLFFYIPEYFVCHFKPSNYICFRFVLKYLVLSHFEKKMWRYSWKKYFLFLAEYLNSKGTLAQYNYPKNISLLLFPNFIGLLTSTSYHFVSRWFDKQLNDKSASS